MKKMRLSKYTSEFLSPRIIFGLDLLLSILASLLVLFFLNMFTGENYGAQFAAWWLGGAAVLTVVAMFVFRSYNVIVRHTTLKDLTNYVLTFLVKDVLLGCQMWLAGWFNTTVLIALFYDMLLSELPF